MAKKEVDEISQEVVSQETPPAEAAQASEEQAIQDVLAEESRPALEGLRKMTLAAIGAAAIAGDKLEALTAHLVERGAAAEAEAKKMAGEMRQRRKAGAKQAEAEFEKRLRAVLARADIASKAEVEALTAKVSELTQKISELQKPS